MTTTAKRILSRAALALVATVGLVAGGGTLYAYGQAVGRDQVVTIDAGQLDQLVAADHAPDAGPVDPTAAAPTSVQVPAPSSSPGGLFELAKDARKVGGLWLAIVVVLFAVAAEVRKRTAPGPADEPLDPRSWRARSYALSCGIAAVTATLVDIKFGAGVGWAALAVPGAFAVGRVMDAINPPKGSKATSAAPAA